MSCGTGALPCPLHFVPLAEQMDITFRAMLYQSLYADGCYWKPVNGLGTNTIMVWY